MTPSDPRDRLIFALDVSTRAEAEQWISRLGDAVQFYKLGLEFFLTPDYFPVLQRLADQGKHVFVDLKLFDVPQTVASAVRQLTRYPIRFATVHGNDSILQAAVDAAGDDLGILSVTTLTSLDQADIESLGFACDLQQLVVDRALRAAAIGCAGVVCSGQEAGMVKQAAGADLQVISPGIRPAENRPADDQKRVMTVTQALHNGADYLVIGRPIRQADDPYAAACRIQDQIAAALRTNPA